jgi:hypothetical protein
VILIQKPRRNYEMNDSVRCVTYVSTAVVRAFIGPVLLYPGAAGSFSDGRSCEFDSSDTGSDSG